MDSKKYIGMDVHQGMSSEGWYIQRESTPPGKESEETYCNRAFFNGRTEPLDRRRLHLETPQGSGFACKRFEDSVELRQL
jgi:hypothetical protein